MQTDSSDASPPDPVAAVHDPYAAIRRANFARFWVGSIFSTLGLQMQSATVAWEVYDRTGNTFDLGLVGLVQVIPAVSLALLAGHVADRIDRKWVLIGAVALSGFTSLGLAVVSYYRLPIGVMFGFLALIGVARAFQQPSKNSLVPQLVPREIFSNAVTWNLGGFQLASAVGPALAGWTFSLFGAEYIVYLLQAAAATTFVVLLLGVRRITVEAPSQSATLKSLGEGIEFVWHKKVILGRHGARYVCRAARRSDGPIARLCEGHPGCGPRRLRLDPFGPIVRRLGNVAGPDASPPDG